MGGLFGGRSQSAKTDPRQEARLAEQEEQAEDNSEHVDDE